MTDAQDVSMPLGFTGHDTFALRHGWLEKAYYEVRAAGPENNPFKSDESIIRFGVGKNMVNAIRHWALATHFIERCGEGYRTTSYADRIITELDPYFESPAALWKVHYELAKDPANTTIYWMFSCLNSSSFSREFLERKLSDYATEKGKKAPASKTLKADITVSLAMYCRPKTRRSFSEDDISNPLNELNLVSLNQDGTYSINVGAKKSLPDQLVATAIHKFWEATDPRSSSIKLDTLLYTPGSPGRIFALSESEMVDRLVRVASASKGMFDVSETAGVVQIFKNQRKYDPRALAELWAQS